MRRVLIIGIGAGDPDYVTVQAIKALNRADVFFLVEKGSEKEDLVRLRKEICDRYIENRSYRTVEIQDPERDRTAPGYRAAVGTWRQKRADLYEAAIREELEEDECGAFLVWGDPALYDSTLGILEAIAAKGSLEIEYEVIPGISSVQALAARHKIGLNRVGEPFLISTGRRISTGLPEYANDVVVMLDADCTFTKIDDGEIEIYWGAYVGTDDEILASGRLADVKNDIAKARSEARLRKGWIMDTYLLRRTSR